MPRRWITLSYRSQRAVLTDMLPFEVPPTFSNRGFFYFLKEHEIEIRNGQLSWLMGKHDITPLLKILFAYNENASVVSRPLKEWGREGDKLSIQLNKCQLTTVPFEFRISHRVDGRVLTVIHPRSQIEVANFYANYSSLITYHCSLSEFSIRKPVAVSRFAYFKDRMHESDVEKSRGGVEQSDKEYEQLGSYFVYKSHSNIHRFFESFKYHRCEKKYDYMIQIDVTRCFDSIYTHSICWALLGKLQTKFALQESDRTFGGKFDKLMQRLNHSETNGIVIGPEFSRIFAEIILQSVDKQLLEGLSAKGLTHKKHYQIFRYVDDYFIFYNKDADLELIKRNLEHALKAKKLSPNPAKEKKYSKPIITEMTIAKEMISELFDREIVIELITLPQINAASEPLIELRCDIDANKLITRYKAVVKQSGAEYPDVLNFTFAVVENKLDNLIKNFSSSSKGSRSIKRAVRCCQQLIEFGFFVYSASPKVNHTIRLSRSICSALDFLDKTGASEELKHTIYKFVHDNIFHQLEKNTMTLHREVESLYLLCVMTQIGIDYSFPESLLIKHFRLDDALASTAYNPEISLNHFSITVLLSYIKRDRRYEKIRSFLEAHIIGKFQYGKRKCQIDTELILLFLDLITCPYLSLETKLKLGIFFELSEPQVRQMISLNDYWFTAWGTKFNLLKELDAKRSREVY